MLKHCDDCDREIFESFISCPYCKIKEILDDVCLNDTAKFIDESFKNIDLFSKKNNDYGSIFREFGVQGILIRVNDKINRLKTLDSAAGKVNEKKLETWRDMAVYATIACLLMEETEDNDDSSIS